MFLKENVHAGSNPQRPTVQMRSSPAKIVRAATLLTIMALSKNAPHTTTEASAAASIISNHRTNRVFAAAFRRPSRDLSGAGAAVGSSGTTWATTTDPNGTAMPMTTRGRRRGTRCRGDDDGTRITAVASCASSKTTRRAANVDPSDDPDYKPTLEEMRGQLGLIGRLVANSVEVGVATAGSYMSAGVAGYAFGTVMGTRNLFRNTPPTPPTTPGALPPIDITTTNKLGGTIRNRLSNLNAQALTQARYYGQLSAAFSGFHALTRVCRGGVEDKWNGIVGSAFAGAYLSRSGGPTAMLQGASTYAGFTYLIDVVFGSFGPKGEGGGEGEGGEFDFNDTPVEDRGF